MGHIYTAATKLPLPFDCTLTTYGHAPHHLTLGIEAFDPYITTQVNGIHTIARHMDDENKPPHVSTYLAT